MDKRSCNTKTKRSAKEGITGSNKRQEDVESYDRPYSEVAWHIERDRNNFIEKFEQMDERTSCTKTNAESKTIYY